MEVNRDMHAYVDMSSVALEFTVDPHTVDADVSGCDRGKSEGGKKRK
jgi:hypothetical protein